MNEKKPAKNITNATQKAKMQAKKPQDRDSFLSYRFEIIDDENIYSISFNGKLTGRETKKMLETVQRYLYRKMADGIQLYLDQHGLPYSSFVSSRKPLNHTTTIEFARLLLHSDTSGGVDNYFGNADICYALADYQERISENHYKGCYYVLKRTYSRNNGLYQYSIIAQTFHSDEASGDEHGYFAIRESRDGRHLHNLVKSEGEPVLPTFGSINLMGLLTDIDNIQTAGQAEKIAVK